MAVKREPDLLYLDDVVERLNTTEASIRGHLRRKNYNAVPKPIRLGKRRLAWKRDEFEAWLEQL